MLPPSLQAVQKSPHLSLPANHPSFAHRLVLGGERGNSLLGVLHSISGYANTYFRSSRRLGWKKRKADVGKDRSGILYREKGMENRGRRTRMAEDVAEDVLAVLTAWEPAYRF